MGIEVIRNEAFQIDGINISSSVIRSLLKEDEQTVLDLFEKEAE